MGNTDVGTIAVTPREQPGEALSRLIREQGRKQVWIAEQLGVDRAVIGRLIRGERELTVREAARLADIFGVPLHTFVPEPAA